MNARKNFSAKKAIQNDMAAGKRSNAKLTDKEPQLAFTPGSNSELDPDYMRNTTTDVEVESMIASLNEHVDVAKAHFRAWEVEFIRGMRGGGPYTGKQIVLLNRYYTRMVLVSARNLAQSEV